MKIKPIPVRIFGLTLAALLFGAGAHAGEPGKRSVLSPAAKVGKQIYLRGESSSGRPIDAILGEPPMTVSAKMLPCVNCHGYDGRGIPEGGLTPSNIAWSALTKRYGTIHQSGRRHGPYNEDTLRRAIEKGIDPSQNKLGVGMPSFRMCDDDLESLIAYLKNIENDRDPGVTDSVVTLATMLPLDGPWAHIGTEVRDVLVARIDEVNRQGGTYNRRIDLHILPAAATPDESVARLRSFLEAEEVFALVSPFIPNGETQLAALADERGIPVIASLGTAPDTLNGPSRYLFYLSSSPSVQARALADHFAKQVSDRRKTQPLLVASPKADLIAKKGPPYDAISQAIQAQCRKRGIYLQVLAPYTSDNFSPEVLAWNRIQSEVLFFVGPDADCARLLQKVSQVGRVPDVLLMGSFVGKQILEAPRAFQGKLAAAFPNSPGAQSADKVKEYKAFLARHELSPRGSSARRTAYCGVSVLLEALNETGRELRREHLIRKLEGFWDFETGLGPPLSFGPNRRVGAYGAYVVSFDLENRALMSANRWVEPSD